jgi:tetratricopeptide (TPR) repeat protein
VSDLIRGNQLLRSGKLEEAVAAYQSAIAHNPSFHWSYYKLGEALERLGRWEDAIANYKTAIKINPNSAQFQSSLESAIEARLTSNNSINLNPNPDVNLALNKPTTQRSVYQPEVYGYDAHGACNGKKTGKFGFHTLQENQPWWQIDLQETYQLAEVKIYNRMDCGQQRASTLNVLLSQDALNWELCYSNDQQNVFGGIDGKPLLVNIQNQVARFVRLQLREYEYFHLDEVEIYGIPVTSDHPQLQSSQDEVTLFGNFYNRRIALASGSWCPFNSQNTTWWADAYPLLYLPAYCSFRMTDIWRSFIAQRIAWENGWSVLFHQPTVYQERNEHNLMRDFQEEISGYIHNKAIGQTLENLKLTPGLHKLSENLLVCYEALVSMGFIDKQELNLVQAWLDDLKKLQSNQ